MLRRRITRSGPGALIGALCLGLLCACATPPKTDTKVEILWDTWGIPHIFAADDQRLYYGLAWAQMSSHAQVMLRLYGQARGRAAEY